MTATGAERTSPGSALRPLAQVLANITVLTALLVYFGWRRSATQAEQLGIAESVLGLSTRDYLLRSVRPVLVLLVGVAVAGLVWAALDHRLTRALRSGPSRRARATLRLLGLAWLVLPTAVWLLGFVARPLAFVLFPVSIGVGVLLLLYVASLRRATPPSDGPERRAAAVLQLSVYLLVGVCLFWTAANYAQVEGVQLARQLAGNVTRLPGAVVYSEGRLHLEGPGVVEEALEPADAGPRYRYRGLRLLGHSGGTSFLVSDGWSPRYGVLFALRDDDERIRLDLVRDRR